MNEAQTNTNGRGSHYASGPERGYAEAEGDTLTMNNGITMVKQAVDEVVEQAKSQPIASLLVVGGLAYAAGIFSRSKPTVSELLKSEFEGRVERSIDKAKQAGDGLDRHLNNAYSKSKDFIQDGIEQHPKAVGVGALAVMAAGLAMFACNQKSRSSQSKYSSSPNTPYEERSREELYQRARELEIGGRSTMSKKELIDALRSTH